MVIDPVYVVMVKDKNKKVERPYGGRWPVVYSTRRQAREDRDHLRKTREARVCRAKVVVDLSGKGA